MKNSSSAKTITIRTDAAIISAIGKLADSMDRPRNWVIEEAIRQYLTEQAWQVEGIKDGIKALEKGKSVSHDAVVGRIKELLLKKK